MTCGAGPPRHVCIATLRAIDCDRQTRCRRQVGAPPERLHRQRVLAAAVAAALLACLPTWAAINEAAETLRYLRERRRERGTVVDYTFHRGGFKTVGQSCPLVELSPPKRGRVRCEADPCRTSLLPRPASVGESVSVLVEPFPAGDAARDERRCKLETFAGLWEDALWQASLALMFWGAASLLLRRSWRLSRRSSPDATLR
jgi:hypothetical protein